MTVIIKYDDNGNPQYRSVKGVGVTEEERMKARQLDALLKKKILYLIKQLKLKTKSLSGQKGNVRMYWELGLILRKIYEESGLVDPSEKNLFLMNARLYVPDSLNAKDRGPNRIHLNYCLRLSNIPKQQANMMKWGEWVFLFDSSGINHESRFDNWFKNILSKKRSIINRGKIRYFALVINKLLKNTETSDLSDDQLSRCYETAWIIAGGISDLLNKTEQDNTVRLKLAEELEQHFTQFGEVIDGLLQPEKYANSIIDSIA